MTIRENLWVFNVGDKVTAEETNDNNETLQSWINDHSSTEAYIDAKMAELSTSLGASISSINTQISTLNNQVSERIKQYDISRSNNGYWDIGKTDNSRFAIVFGQFTAPAYRSKAWVSLPYSFGNTNYKVLFSSNYQQSAGDKGSSCSVTNRETSRFQVYGGFEESRPVIFYVAIGAK